jgi:hypothetical protein
MGLGGFLKGALLAPLTGAGALVSGAAGSKLQNRADKKAKSAAQLAMEERQRQQAADQANIARQGDEQGSKFAQEAEAALIGGPNAAENAAKRQEAVAQVQGAQSGALRALQGRLAGQGIRGGTALAAQAGQINQGASQMAENERKLMLEDLAARQAKAKDVFAARLAGRQFGASNAQSAIQGRMASMLQQQLEEKNRNKVLGIF